VHELNNYEMINSVGIWNS